MHETRKLAAILAADVVGYSRLAGSDEDRTLARLRALRSDLIDPTIAVHRGPTSCGPRIVYARPMVCYAPRLGHSRRLATPQKLTSYKESDRSASRQQRALRGAAVRLGALCFACSSAAFTLASWAGQTIGGRTS